MTIKCRPWPRVLGGRNRMRRGVVGVEQAEKKRRRAEEAKGQDDIIRPAHFFSISNYTLLFSSSTFPLSPSPPLDSIQSTTTVVLFTAHTLFCPNRVSLSLPFPLLLAHAHSVGVKRRRRLSPCPEPRSMSVANLLPRRFLHHNYSLKTPFLLSRPFVRQNWVYTLHSSSFATSTLKYHPASTMASESLNSSDGDAREHSNRSSSSENRGGTPYAARAAAGAAVANSFFPLGYREGFSQWVSSCDK